MDEAEKARARFTARSDNAHTRWADQAEQAGNLELAAEHRRYAAGSVVRDGETFRTVKGKS